MKVKITKRKLWHEVNNDMCHNYYYVYWGRIINDCETKYKRFKFVVSFDVFELQEYFNYRDEITEEDKWEYAELLADSLIDTIISYDNCKYFYELCNQSIENYNKICV